MKPMRLQCGPYEWRIRMKRGEHRPPLPGGEASSLRAWRFSRKHSVMCVGGIAEHGGLFECGRSFGTWRYQLSFLKGLNHFEDQFVILDRSFARHDGKIRDAQRSQKFQCVTAI